MPRIPWIIVDVVTLTPTTKSMVTRQAKVTLEWMNTQGKKTKQKNRSDTSIHASVSSLAALKTRDLSPAA